MTSRTWRTRTPRGGLSCERRDDREARRGPPSPTTGSPGPISPLRPSSSPRSPPPRTRAPRWATWRRSSRKTTRTERRRRRIVERDRPARFPNDPREASGAQVKAKTQNQNHRGTRTQVAVAHLEGACSGTAARSRSMRTACRDRPRVGATRADPNFASNSAAHGDWLAACWNVADALGKLGDAHGALAGDFETARRWHEEASATFTLATQRADSAEGQTTSAGWCTTGGVSACRTRSARRTAR